MPEVLALLDRSPQAQAVAAAAAAVAQRRGTRASALHVRATGDPPDLPAPSTDLDLTVVQGDTVERILQHVADPEVRLVVLGARDYPSDERATGRVALQVLQRVGKPCLVIPPGASVPDPRRTSRALLHVDADGCATTGIREAVELLGDAGFALSGVHVFNEQTTPRFRDQTAHGGQSWAAALLDRVGTTAAVDMQLRTGPTAESLLAAADAGDFGLIALCSPRTASAERADAVHELLRRATVPVLLVPIETLG